MRESVRAIGWDSGYGHRARHRRTALGGEKIRFQERGRQWEGVDKRQLSWNGNRYEHREWEYDRGQQKEGNWSKHRQWGYDRGQYKQTTAFFFTNIPEDWSYSDMWRTFGKFRRVFDIYSPQRRSKNGRRFGFVRFLNVRNTRELENQLDQIKVDGLKLWVNLAKYPEGKVNEVTVRKIIPSKGTVHGKSYADVVRGQGGCGPVKIVEKILVRPMKHDEGNIRAHASQKQSKTEQVWKQKNKGEEWAGLEFNVKEEEFQWLQGCYVGIAHSVEIVPNLQEKLYMEGYFSCRLRAMGGKLVLMDGEDKDEIKDLVEGASEWLGQWFFEVKPWSPSMVTKERFVWMRCQGAPLHAWSPEFFEELALVWGKCICLDDSTSKKRRFDVARFLLSTSIMDTISVHRKVKVNGVIYELKFSEEELTNSLFSLKYDFKPSFNSDSKLDESWSDASDSSAGFDEDNGGAEIGGEAGEDISGRETFPSKERGSRLGEEESVDVVADSFEMDMKEDDAGERVDLGICVLGSKVQNFSNSNPAASLGSYGLGTQPNSDPLNGHATKGIWVGEGRSKEYWAGGRRNESPQKGIEVRPDRGVKEKHSSEKVEKKGTMVLENGSSCNSERGCSEGGREVVSGAAQKKDRKKRKKRSKSCTSIYQKSILLGFMKQKKKNRGRCGARQSEEEAVPVFLPSTSNSIAGGSVGDNGIQNCNRLLKEAPNKLIANDIWEFAKKIGAVAEEEDSVIKKLEEMERRDRSTKEKESLKGPNKDQKETKKSGIDRKFCSLLWGSDEFEYVAKDPTGLSGAGKRSLWEDLKDLVLQTRGLWCLVGDFNTVKNVEEKVGSKVITIEMREFNNFIMESELIDIPLVGRKYTWYHSSGKLMSRIDRFLMSEEWLNKWGEATQWGLTRTVSDHCPILLRHQKVNWGPKPFRFFDVWLEQEGCREVIREAWRRKRIHGWAGFRIKEKLKNTKEAVKKWSRNFALEIERRITEATAEISQLDQKSRKAWLVKGDANTKVFHNCVKGRWKRNEINSIHVKGVQITKADKLKEEIASFFEETFTEEKWRRPVVEGLQFKQISPANNVFLTAPFFEEEIKTAAAKKGFLEGVEVGNKGFKVTHLQYADDTLMFGTATDENVWAMKSILRTFKLISRLKINFNKSQLIGIGVKDEWLEKMAWILCCKKGSLPFKYLGIPIGGRSGKLSLWKPVLEGVTKKLSAWKGRYLSLGGRITLINLVLSSLPVFWMSVYMISKGTILLLDKIRRRFLWGGVEGGKKINWVRWDKVCRDKDQGGLGVKDLRKFNLALLGKWWGRLVNDEEGLWKKVLLQKYGREGEPRYNWLRDGNGFGSRWWRDICRLNVIDKDNGGWLAKGLNIKIGEGGSVKFWWDDWSGKGLLANKYLRLYLISAGKDNLVSQMGRWLDGSWIWNLQWRRRLYSWEVLEEAEILKEIQETTIMKGKTDVWEWVHSNNGVYTTKSAYKALTMEIQRDQPGVNLQKVWIAIVPSKVSAFSWQLLQDKIPTKANLFKRGIIQNMEECKCEFCGYQMEETSHIFTHCKVAYDLWNACFRWWGIRTALDREGSKVFQQHSSGLKVAEIREGWRCIWLVVVWTVWLARNDSIFKGKEADKCRLLELVQLRSFSWKNVGRKAVFFLGLIGSRTRYLALETLQLEKGQTGGQNLSKQWIP
ncbi:hypothetical protein SLEP1_g43574 [Rubroshorea leprosula]|uniref:RRM domain-containing protein n=1 Tax=Rubroshorea leprosula TaxID=152421 RepID=A0AAV5LDE1_9ROSI|nr:hypothetical protein SLEP1_g43574 [Rubroshorea leprosula]